MEKIIKMDDIKLYSLIVGTFAVSLTSVADLLKIILLVVSIGYTAFKWWKLIHNDKNQDK